MVTTIIKRDGRRAEFRQDKIAEAVGRAFQACGAMQDRAAADEIAQKVVDKLESGAIEGVPTVEGVQDLVEETLIEEGFVQTAKSYILYRAERSRARDVNSRLIQTLKDITFSKAADSDMKRENANIDADTAMGTMLKYGSESAKQFYEMCVIEPKFARAHREGDIHIHDMDFYTLTTTCCQIELRKLFKEKGAQRGMEKITLNDIILYAVSRTLANPDFRALNANLLSGDQMKYYRHVNLGVAVDTDRGLMVPTIFKADTLSLKEISQTAKKLASECKAGTINPDLLRDGSFTVTNLGSLGIESFTPVINPPQTGILGVNTIVNRVREVNGQLALYPSMTLSLTYDHRALDGAPASRFLHALCQNLENITLLLAE